MADRVAALLARGVTGSHRRGKPVRERIGDPVVRGRQLHCRGVEQLLHRHTAEHSRIATLRW